MRSLSKIGWSLAFSALACACQTYDAPPDATLERPEEGTFLQGDVVPIRFSEPIDPSTLKIRIWPDVRDKEGEIPSDAKPLIAECTGGKTCEGLEVKWIKEGSDTIGVDMVFDPENVGKPGSPILVEIRSGLEDEAGTDTGVPYFFDLQFRLPESRFNADPVSFDDGVFILAGSVTMPVPVDLRMICEIQVEESGEMVLLCAEANQVDGADRTSTNPEEQVVNDTEIGFTVYATGFVKLTEDARRLMETDPFDIFVPLGPLSIQMTGVRITGEVVKGDGDKDQINGSLSYQQLTIVRGKRETPYEASSAPLGLTFVPEDKRSTFTGRPEICGDLCGAVVGQCTPPEAFPPAQFCMTGGM